MHSKFISRTKNYHFQTHFQNSVEKQDVVLKIAVGLVKESTFACKIN